jgi:hypothetical protein
MFMFLVSAMIFFLASPPAGAVLPDEFGHPVQPWFCGLQAELTGDASHFILHGRDLWTGRSRLICDSGLRRTCKNVDISFRSRSEGFGADRKSVLRLAMVIMSDAEPHSVVEQTIASDQIESGLVTWRIEKMNRQIVVDVLTQDQSEALNSLKAGVLSVREPPIAQSCP